MRVGPPYGPTLSRSTSSSRSPTKQVYVGSGLPTLPRCIVEKMLKWEYINFNELLPFSDPKSEEQQGLTQTPEQFMLFPGLGLLQHGQSIGHQVKYSFLQWASCFVIYMAVMASHSNNIIHMSKPTMSFSKPTENIGPF